MPRYLLQVALLVSFNVSPNLYSDSTLTSTDFWRAYWDVEIVKDAYYAGYVTDEIAYYLKDPDISIDKKLAVCNALGWSFEGKRNHQLLLSAWGYSVPEDRELRVEDVDDLRSDMLACVGYLMALDDYFHPEKAIPFISKAAFEMPDSYAVEMAKTMVLGSFYQHLNHWCLVWTLTKKTEYDFRGNRDLRPAAREIILDYMALYEKSCGR